MTDSVQSGGVAATCLFLTYFSKLLSVVLGRKIKSSKRGDIVACVCFCSYKNGSCCCVKSPDAEICVDNELFCQEILGRSTATF